MLKIVKRFSIFLFGREAMSNFFAVFDRNMARIRRFIFLKKDFFLKNGLKIKRYGIENRNVFFGYYDKNPFDKKGGKILASSAKKENTPPAKGDICDLGLFDLKNGKFLKFGSTDTWCWQQGCRLQWYDYKKNTVIYNRIVGSEYGSVIQEIDSGKIIKSFNFPIYDLSFDGKWGVTLNFSRLHRLRPGYGYVNLKDKTINQDIPKYDGVWIFDTEKKKKELLISLEELASLNIDETMNNSEHYVNFLSISKTGKRIAFLHVWQNKKNFKRNVRLVVFDKSSNKLFFPLKENVSHYSWISDDELIVTATSKNGEVFYCTVKFPFDKKSTLLFKGTEVLDGHPSFSRCSKRILTDTVVDKFNSQKILLIENKNIVVILSALVPFSFRGEVRCDFHPRWNWSENMICIDSADSGLRQIIVIEL